MTIKLLEDINGLGVKGVSLTLDPAVEARQVSLNRAVYTTLPDIGDTGIPVRSRINPVTGGMEISASGTKVALPQNTLLFANNITKALAKISAAPILQSSILFAGHSIVAGVGSDDTGNAADSTWKTNALPVAFSRRLNASFGTPVEAGMRWVGPDQQYLWTLGGGAAFDANQYQGSGIGGYRLVLSAAAHTAQVSVVGTDFTVYMLGTVAGVQLRYTVDGGGTQTATAAPNDPTGFGTGVYYKVTITGMSNAAHTIVLMGPTANGVTIIGYECRTQTTQGVVVHRAGLQAMCLADIFAGSIDNTDTTGPANWISAGNEARRIAQSHTLSDKLGIDLAIYLTDVNDLAQGYSAYSYSLASVRRHIDNTVAFYASVGLPLIFACGPWRKVSTYASGVPYTQDDVVTQYYEACKASSNAAFIDLRTPVYAAQGFDNAAGSLILDHVHPHKIGHSGYGATLANAIVGAIRT